MIKDVQDNDINCSNQTSTEALLWNDFVTAKTANDLCHAWLALICEQIKGASAAAVLVESQEAQIYVPMAVWPEATPNMGRLAKIVEISLRERRSVVQSVDQSRQADGALRRTRLRQQIQPKFHTR